ncbi:MAG: carboxypeptidase regulatory-like domain-containing protein [bacterium]|nr:carboxypeptidase regulatory-like domain-containing protein [bacterium]
MNKQKYFIKLFIRLIIPAIILIPFTLSLVSCNGAISSYSEKRKKYIDDKEEYARTHCQIGGSVTGLASGPLLLKNELTNETIEINSNGDFLFPDEVHEYDITVKTNPAQQVCTVANGSGKIENSTGQNMTAIAVTCYNDEDPEVTGLAGQPSGLTNTNSIDVSVSGNNLVYYSYKIYHSDDEAAALWSGRVPGASNILLSSAFFNKDGLYTLKVRGINAADRWQDEAGSFTVSWALDTTIASVEEMGLVSGTSADTNLEKYLSLDTGIDAGDGSSIINNDGTSINSTGELHISTGSNAGDIQYCRYLIVTDADKAVYPGGGNWSSAIALTAGGTNIPAPAIAQDGVYGIYIVLGDSAGNWQCSPVTNSDCRSEALYRKFEVDATAPVLALSNSDMQISGLPPLLSPDTSVNISLSSLTDGDGKPLQTGGTAIASYSYSLDSGSWSTDVSDFAAAISESGLSAASHTLEIKIKDKTGNESAPYSYTWDINTDAVIAQFDSGLPGAVSDSAAGIEGVIQISAPGVYDEVYKWNMTAGNSCSTDLDSYTEIIDSPANTGFTPVLAANTQQTYSICVVAKDISGNFNSSVTPAEGDITKYTFLGDTKAPEGNSLSVTGGAMPVSGSFVNISQSANIISAGSTSDITLTGSDVGSNFVNYKYRVSNDGGSTWSATYNNSGSGYSMSTPMNLTAADMPATGEYTLVIQVVAEDEAGNWGDFGTSAQVKELNYLVDQTAPEHPAAIAFGGDGIADPADLGGAGAGTARYTNPNNSESIWAYNIGKVDFDKNLTVEYTRPASWGSGDTTTVEINLAASSNYLYNSGSPTGDTPAVVKTQSIAGSSSSCTFSNVDEDGVSYYIQLRVQDQAGNWSEYTYTNNEDHYDDAHNIESVGLIRLIIKDASNGNPINGLYVSLYNINDPAVPTNIICTGGVFGDGVVQALCRKGDNIFTGKVEDLTSYGYAALTDWEPAAKNNVSARPGELIEYSMFLTSTSIGSNVNSLTGAVVDANDGNGITNATVQLIKWDNSIAAQATPATDSFEFNDIPSGTYSIKVTKEGYFDLLIDNVFLNGDSNPDINFGRLAMCGVLTEPHIRVVVQWGSSPQDLDLHMVGPSNQTVNSDGDPSDRFHIYWSEKNFNENLSTGYYPGGGGDTKGTSTTASLVQDDTSGFGPEAINIYGLDGGYAYGKYNYSIFHWTDYNSTPEWNQNFPITARIFDSQGLVLEVSLPDGAGANDTWRMFEIDVQGPGRDNRVINVVNQFVDRNGNYSSKSASDGMDW